MDIMDIQAVESKLSDVTVTPIPRSQVQNFYNYQQQRDQREQQPQIQISAIHHTPRDRSGGDHHAHHSSSSTSGGSSVRDIYAKQRERDYHHHHQQQQQQQHHHHTQQQQSNAASSSSSSSAAAAVAVASALQYTQQLQAQLALLQQQASPSVSRSINGNQSAGGSSSSNVNTPSQLKYPLSTSPVIVTTQTSANITTPMTSTANLPTVGSSASTNGLTKYAQLLAVIEEMGRDIRPTYTGSRNSTERLKRGIVHARILVRECLMETERSARQ